jgi:AcrR family transcriptional regulator
MSPRRSLADARATRQSIVDRAVEVSSVEGLEGLTIGGLASRLGMSKSGVIGHFGTKEALQLEAFEAASDVFRREVWDRTAGADPGLPRLLAICDAWITYLEREVFPGGCFLTAAACEFDGRGGPVRDAIADALSRWYRALESQVRVAIEAGDLPAGSDPNAIAQQLNALAMGANQALQLFGDRAAARNAHRAMRAALSTPDSE